MPPIVDIIVPVYRGEAVTRACLASVLRAAVRLPVEVVVVDDASPEPAIPAYLRSLQREGRITLVRHGENRGFVASANEAMAMHPERDVVLLNSDTEVADGWLDRLAAHAAGDASVGTVTPFSGNATICSYPRTLAPNPLPEGEDTARLDAAFAAANAGRGVDILTAVGFCMYIARRCLAAVGGFDEARYGRGYGEEVDFCMRASRAGFRHRLAGDVYVRHIGEVSFGGAGMQRRVEAQATVDALYPEFQARLAEHLRTDPPRMLRRRADLERLRRSPRPRALFVHGPGEAEDAQRQAGAAASKEEALVLLPDAGGRVALSWWRAGEELALWPRWPADQAALLALLRAIRVQRVVVAPSAAAFGPWSAGMDTEDAPGAIPELPEAWLFPEPSAAAQPSAPAAPARGSPLRALARRLRKALGR